MTTKTSKRRVGDLVIYVESLEYCTELASLRNGAVAAISVDSVLGLPVKAGASGADFVIAVAGEEASVIGLVMDGPEPLALAATTNSAKKYQVLTKPPCIVNQNRIKATDPAGAAYTIATIVTALKALHFRVYTEPTKVTTQTT